MANPITGAYQAQQTAPVHQTTQTNTASKPAGNKAAAPQDTVTISPAGQAASQAHASAQTAKPANDGDHDGS
jgi:hypothetical protein